MRVRACVIATAGCVGGAQVVLTEGDEAECGAVGLSAGPHAVRAVAFQSSPDGSFNATYKSPAHPSCPTPPLLTSFHLGDPIQSPKITTTVATAAQQPFLGCPWRGEGWLNT
jgi:hypothetical protein